jgi:hypothetical protein
MADDALAIALDSQTFMSKPQPIPLDSQTFMSKPQPIPFDSSDPYQRTPTYHAQY